MRWWWFLGLAACGDQYEFNQACNKTYAAICKHKIDCQLIEKLWKNVEQYWAQQNMLVNKSLLS